MQEIVSLKDAIHVAFRSKRYEDCLRLISSYANIMYQYNQTYCDDDIENEVRTIGEIVCNNDKEEKIDDVYDVVFYDGFGLDNRGLALQYINAIISNGLHVAYVVKQSKREMIPTITGIVEKDRHSKIMTYNDRGSYIERVKFLYKLICKYCPQHLFIYMHPADVSATAAFDCVGHICQRYYIDLTDHAFWIGKNVADYYLEFREYGAKIAWQYRSIQQDRLILLPFYPFMQQWKPFEGFPFNRNGKIVIFSGGSLYKTYDGEDNAYYRVIEKCLAHNPNVVFWYAGSGDNSELKSLELKFPGQVCHTTERKDLLDILKNCDIYYNTYPQTGGLMMQYAAIAGKAPITLESRVSGGGELLDEDKLGIKYNTVDETADVLIRMAEDRSCRMEINNRVKNSVISESCFQKNLMSVLNSKQSEFSIVYEEVDTSELRDVYKKRFEKGSFERYFFSDAVKPFMKLHPILASKVVSYKLKYKIDSATKR